MPFPSVKPPNPSFILPDLLAPELRLIFCGTAPGYESARRNAYYAHPGNKFWPALAETGLTPRLFAPAEYALLTRHGIGLTDLAKHSIGNDSDLAPEAFDAASLRQKIAHYQPGILAFTSKTAGRIFFGQIPPLGLQTSAAGRTRFFVLPSPSGQARRYWNIAIWHHLTEMVRNTA